MSTDILELEGITKSYGKTEILHGISLSVHKGEVYGLVGQNGAGKTTLLRIISGLMKPTMVILTSIYWMNQQPDWILVHLLR